MKLEESNGIFIINFHHQMDLSLLPKHIILATWESEILHVWLLYTLTPWVEKVIRKLLVHDLGRSFFNTSQHLKPYGPHGPPDFLHGSPNFSLRSINFLFQKLLVWNFYKMSITIPYSNSKKGKRLSQGLIFFLMCLGFYSVVVVFMV